MTTDGGSAGTAGSGFRTDPAPHAWQPTTPDSGCRPSCRGCEHEKPRHDEEQRLIGATT